MNNLRSTITDDRIKRLGTALILSVVFCLSGCWDSVDVAPQAPAVEVTQTREASTETVAKVESSHPPSPALSPAITAFLEKFDVLSAKGFVPTLRSGSTGIGYTLETMLEIEENNSPRGDFMEMELKAFRDDDVGLDDAEKMNLFLKEPKWTDGLTAAKRVKEYGYVDDNGRTALYSAVTHKTSSHHFRMSVDRSASEGTKVWLDFKGQHIGFWSAEVLEKRLLEKHSETAFVSAHAKGKGKQEQFHYFGVTWCAQPSIEKFLSLIEQGGVLLELRMHLKENGAARNHGSAFRIQQNRIRDLYLKVSQLRPTSEENR